MTRTMAVKVTMIAIVSNNYSGLEKENLTFKVHFVSFTILPCNVDIGGAWNSCFLFLKYFLFEKNINYIIF